MEIAFILPHEGTHPLGGFKVVYEYANGLAKRGHTVHIVHTAKLLPGNLRWWSLWRYYSVLRYLPHALRRDWKPSSWFMLHPTVRLHWVPAFADVFFPKADAYIATWWLTAERMAKIERMAGKRFYLIQHLETWAGSEDRVMATWKAPLEKIVIARWLQDIASDIGEKSHYIPNGLDFSKFGCDVPPEDRPGTRVAMLFHKAEWKGTADGLAAMAILKKRYPALEAELFGFYECPKDMPSWMVYHQLPEQTELRRIYNRAAIFLAPSHVEGWGLPASEAMTCGVAVVATDIGGHREFCVDGENALLTTVKNPEKMAEAAAKLIDDPGLRLRISRKGSETIRSFTWDAAVESFEKVLDNTLRAKG